MTTDPGAGTPRCHCTRSHEPRLIVVTGGPGAGKTAVLEIVRRSFCEHVVILPEAAGILFAGGFPRRESPPARRAAQIAIFHTQRALEDLAMEESGAAVVLCDRGTLDGLAYWPSTAPSFYQAVGTTKERELARYDAIVQLRTPTLENGYHQDNPLRIESAAEAQIVDVRTLEAWSGHPQRALVPATSDFMMKASEAIAEIQRRVPPCCLSMNVREVGKTHGEELQ